MEFGHMPVVEVLSSAHRVCEVNFPVVGGIDRAQRCGNAAFGHHRVGFSKKGLANETDSDSGRRGFDRRAQSCAAGANNKHVVFELLILRH